MTLEEGGFAAVDGLAGIGVAVALLVAWGVGWVIGWVTR